MPGDDAVSIGGHPYREMPQCAMCGVTVKVNGHRPTVCPTDEGGCGRPWIPITKYAGPIPESEWPEAKCKSCGADAPNQWGNGHVPPGTRLMCTSCSKNTNEHGFPHDHVLGDGYPANDVGNGMRFVEACGEAYRYIPNYGPGEWFVYDSGRWTRDRLGQAYIEAKEVFKTLLARATSELQTANGEREAVKRAKATLEHALRSGSIPSIKRVLEAAATDPRVSKIYEEFDQQPYLINAKNVTIDLRTGEALPHDPENYFTRRTDTHYDPDAKCPNFLNFLTQIMCGRKQLVDYLQRAFGCSLIGVNLWDVLFILYGRGRNGKSTLVNIIAKALGDSDFGFAGAADPGTFGEETARRGGPREDLARLAGLRFVSVVETGAGHRLDGATVKRATSRDPVVCRFLHQRSQFQYVPSFKVFLATNDRPGLDGADFGVTRRVRLIPFEYTVPDDQVDLGLAQKLEDELPGVLAWMVRGAVDVLKNGLRDPPEVLAATQDYADEQDDLAPFLGECCDINPTQVGLDGVKRSTDRTPLLYAYRVYAGWAERNRIKRVSNRTFAAKLRQRGLETARSGNNGAREIVGLKINLVGAGYLDAEDARRRDTHSMGYPEL